jgi:hypothetical protein
MVLIGKRWYYLDGDPQRTPVHTEDLMMWEDPPELDIKRFNWVMVEERCPSDQVLDGESCTDWIPLSIDPVCTGLDRVATAYDIPDPERYAKCLLRAETICAAPGADALYCACLKGQPLVPGVNPRCASDNACHVAMADTTFLPDYRYADPTSACNEIPVQGLDITKAELVTEHTNHKESNTGEIALIVTYILLGVVVVGVLILTLRVVVSQKH